MYVYLQTKFYIEFIQSYFCQQNETFVQSKNIKLNEEECRSRK